MKPYYAAENSLEFVMQNGGMVEMYGSTFVAPDQRKFGDLDGVRAYLGMVCSWLDLGDPPGVRSRKGNRKAVYEPADQVIAIPDHQGSRSSWAMNEITVLHELAHHLSSDGHGEEWAGRFVWLVERCIGYEAAFLLRVFFNENDVSFQEPS